MDCIYRPRLSAFHDGELPEAEARRMERHLETCAACAAELADVREVSRAFGPRAAEPVPPAVLARARAAADARAGESPATGSPVFRIAGLLSALAASVLVIASAWLWEAPADEGRPAPRVATRAPAEDWERVAMTLDPGPLPAEGSESPQRQMLADARRADWVLRNLEEGGR